tara:strand:+ start:1487 stop:2008 length:522 start_codon:yes stop_codon:yes gene_type:complete
MMVFISILVAFNLRSFPIFLQRRPGLNGKVFTLVKFKTMKDASHDHQNNENNRLTKFGIFLRKFSLDELPELFNILFGHMSFIGPRPLLEEYLEHYTPEQHKRHNVKPGLTGLAQISGRNSLTWEERFKLDLEYVETISFKKDISIFLQTFKVAMKGDDIDHDGKIMKKFRSK